MPQCGLSVDGWRDRLPSGFRNFMAGMLAGKSTRNGACDIGTSLISGSFSIAMFDYRGVLLILVFDDVFILLLVVFEHMNIRNIRRQMQKQHFVNVYLRFYILIYTCVVFECLCI